MAKNNLIRSLKLRNILSFGNEAQTIELKPLNVIIGQNASGKSNLIEILGFMRAIPTDVMVPISAGGGFEEWAWKGEVKVGGSDIEAEIENYSEDTPSEDTPLKYALRFGGHENTFWPHYESIESCNKENNNEDKVKSFYKLERGKSTISAITSWDVNDKPLREERELRFKDLKRNESILSQFTDIHTYPELAYIGDRFKSIQMFREWSFGRDTAARKPQKTDLPSDFLSEDAGNLSLIINDLQNRKETKQLIVDKLKLFYDGIEDITTKIISGYVQIFIHQRGLQTPIPATRLSDGTLQYLCLLSVLCHPEPPPLICIEEPELGIHPDIIPTIAELLIEASKRTQIIVTTHSESLISALSEYPEYVLVCERYDTGTQMKRLNKEQLSEWLEKYTLGELWSMGEIGGVRW
ncbi:MAG: AAA family ATPase [Calditrichaeota bacterium]|nr:AAA family ATPase [Calditrichota bacterium]